MEEFMLQEMQKPRVERNFLPVVEAYCTACTLNCSSLSCPLIQAKWFDNYVPLAQVARTQEREIAVEPERTEVVSNDFNLKSARCDQLSLFR